MPVFSITTKNNEVIEKTVSEQWRNQALGRLELTLVVNTSQLEMEELQAY